MTDNTATNSITGDRIATKRSTTYADNYANIDWSVKQETNLQTNNCDKKQSDHLNLLLIDEKDGF